MISALLCLLTFAVYLLFLAIYHVSMACLAHRLGIIVQVVSIGFGRSICEWRGRHWKYQIGWLPLGGYTKFFGESNGNEPPTEPGDMKLEIQEPPIFVENENEAPGGVDFRDAPVQHRLAVVLLGPLFLVAIGASLLLLPVLLKWNQLTSIPLEETKIKPTSIGGLENRDAPATIEGQWQLIDGTIGEAMIRTFTWGPIDGWGAFGSSWITGGYLAQHSWQNWFTFMGLTAFFLGVANLLPIPTLNGGHVVLLLSEIITGKKVPETLLSIAMYLGLAVVFVISIRWYCYDAAWLWKFFRS